MYYFNKILPGKLTKVVSEEMSVRLSILENKVEKMLNQQAEEKKKKEEKRDSCKEHIKMTGYKCGATVGAILTVKDVCEIISDQYSSDQSCEKSPKEDFVGTYNNDNGNKK